MWVGLQMGHIPLFLCECKITKGHVIFIYWMLDGPQGQAYDMATNLGLQVLKPLIWEKKEMEKKEG